MNRIELTTAEQEILNQLLQSSLATLEIEIRHADYIDFKELLKERRSVLNGLLAKMERPETMLV